MRKGGIGPQIGTGLIILIGLALLILYLLSTQAREAAPPAFLSAIATPTLPPSPLDSPTPELLGTRATPDWFLREDLFFQPGDLPETVRVARFWIADERWLEDSKVPAAAIVSLSLDQPEKQSDYGRVDAYYFNNPATLDKAYRYLASFSGGVPQPNIGDQALLSPPSGLLFRRCHTVVDIRLSEAQQPIVLAYAARLDQRLDAVDCQGVTGMPMLTPPPPVPTWTPAPTAVITHVISATVQHLPDPEGANSIRAYTFADGEHGWLALGATILATTDGGRSWRDQVQVDSRVTAITFISAEVGWIETQTGYTQTTDGGMTWHPVQDRPDDGKRLMPRPAVSVRGLLEGYAFCPDDAPHAGPFTAIDLQTGWAYCIGGEGSHTGFRRLFGTNDGGEHWQLLTEQPPFGWYGVADLFFLDPQRGWAAADGLYATEDGGTTWRALPVAQTFEDRTRAIQFLSPSQGFVVVNDHQHNEHRDTLLRTDDGGMTWQEIYPAPPPALWPVGPMQFFADGSGVAAGDYATLLSTTDAGRNWTKTGSLDHPCSDTFVPRFSDLSFPDRLHGWATLRCAGTSLAVLYRTTDGGVTWTTLAAPDGMDDGYVAVSFVDQQTGYVVTDLGYLLRTDDGGATFAPVDQVRAHTTRLTFVTKEHGWELRGSQLVETTDGGYTWNPVSLGRPVQQFALLAQRPEGRAWVSIHYGSCKDNPNATHSLLATRDDGHTWTEYQLGPIPCNRTSPGLDSLQFADALHGWLVAGSALYYTADGGQSWTQLH